MKIKVTDNIEVRNAIREGLKKTGGYCPCAITMSEETRCLCKEFLESTEEGYCHCGLYYKEKK